MARPKATTASIAPQQRGEALRVRLSFGEVKYPTPVLARVAAEYVAKNGYVKHTHPDYLAINEKLALATTHLEQAFAITQAAADLTVARIRQEYLRLSSEAEAAARQAARRQQVEQKAATLNRNLREERLLHAKIRPDEDLDQKLVELEAKLVELRERRDNQRRLAGTYEDDQLTTYLLRYATRKGVATMAESTTRSNASIVSQINQFRPGTRLQDVDEQWLVAFQDWLVTTPSSRPVYSHYPNLAWTPGCKLKRQMRGKVLYHKKSDAPRKNGSVKRYIERVKCCLRHYQARPHELPQGVVISDSYKLYEFELAGKEDNVVALEEHELAQLLRFTKFKNKAERRALDVFILLCATGLRFSDYARITPATIEDDTIHLTTKKTKKYEIKVAIPLSPITRSILEKYHYDMSTCQIHYTVARTILRRLLSDAESFPSLQEPHTSKNHSGADEVTVTKTRAQCIGTHSGRRTFINICLDYNVPLNKLIGMTGHTDVKTLMVYANKRKNVNKYLQNIFTLPAYGAQDYQVVEVVEVVA